VSIGAPDFDHMVYVRLIEACNLHCEHCFIPNNPKRMSWDQIEAIPDKVKTFAAPGNTILFQMHGGEPTLVGVELMRKVVLYLRSNLEGFKVVFSLQTNLMNFDHRWADLYKEFFDGVVGVSWDPVIRRTKANKPESNVDFEQRFWRNLESLQSAGLEPYMVITTTKILMQQFRNPSDLIDYLRSKGIRHVHFERLTRTGYAITNWDRIGVSNRQYSLWIARFAMAYSRYIATPRDHYQDLHISPLDGLTESVRRLRSGKRGGYGCLSGACDTRFHTFDDGGYYKACTALTSESNNRNAVGVSEAQPTRLVEMREDRQLDCHSCQFKPICSSGCMATPKTDESGECAGGYSAFKLISEQMALAEQPSLIAVSG
jgi:radical SAM protein with 4Fe4S-binding SPASM domain